MGIKQREKRGLCIGKEGEGVQRPRAKRIFCLDPQIAFAAVPLLSSSIRIMLSTRLLITENTKWKMISDITVISLPHSVSLMVFLGNCHKICTFNL